MTFHAWSIIAKPGDMSYEGMMHVAKTRRIINNRWIGWTIHLYAWCLDFYYFKLIRFYIRVRYRLYVQCRRQGLLQKR